MKIYTQICEYIGLKNISIAKGTHQGVFFIVVMCVEY
jgi:hypothetical protein